MTENKSLFNDSITYMNTEQWVLLLTSINYKHFYELKSLSLIMIYYYYSF